MINLMTPHPDLHKIIKIKDEYQRLIDRLEYWAGKLNVKAHEDEPIEVVIDRLFEAAQRDIKQDKP